MNSSSFRAAGAAALPGSGICRDDCDGTEANGKDARGSTTRAVAREEASRSRRAAAPADCDAGSPDCRAPSASALASHTRGGEWGAIIVSLTRGDTLFSQNADGMMQPASTMKMYTSAVALDRFGPDFTFHTPVLRDGTDRHRRNARRESLSARRRRSVAQPALLARRRADGRAGQTDRGHRHQARARRHHRRRHRVRRQARSRRLEDELPRRGIRGARVGAVAERESGVGRGPARRAARRS